MNRDTIYWKNRKPGAERVLPLLTGSECREIVQALLQAETASALAPMLIGALLGMEGRLRDAGRLPKDWNKEGEA